MIPAPDRRLRVFVSSTLGELAAERAAVQDAIESMRLAPVMAGAVAGEDPDEHLAHPLSGGADIFLGIYWQSHGQDQPGREESRLDEELTAGGAMPRLIYVKEPAPEREPRLADLLAGLRRSGVDGTPFHGPEDLADRVREDLANLLAARQGPADRSLPTGTVTFLFADVEGSTPMLESHGDPYADLLRRFRREIESVVARHGGTLIRTEGDGAFAVFPDAMQSVAAAIDADRRFLGYPAPGPLRVRIGLHTGDGVVVDDDYVGIDVHRAARVASAAHGAQIVVSATTHEMVRGDGHVVKDLGWYHLKGLSRPEHLHQIASTGLPLDFPPPRARSLSKTRLPRPPNGIVGREAETAAATKMIQDGVRLLTITGPGGVGKTRLSLDVGEMVRDHFQGGVGFVDLAGVSDPGRVAETISTALGRSIEGSASADDVLVDELRDRRFLIILDNFEQVAGSAPVVARLLERLPDLQFLVTSRTALRISAEREYQLGPLAVPGPDDGPVAAVESPAVRLLLERARSVRPDLTVTAENVASISGLVRRLDGIPLAIEIAASRFRLLSPADVLRRLATTLDIGSGSGDLPDRQRTLRSTIDWSYRLLTPAEQTVFRRLGVFAGGCTLEAAEAVVSETPGTDAVSDLESLAAHSLVRVGEAAGGGSRVDMLSALRDYAYSLLEESGELDTIRDRHAVYYRRTVEEYPHGTAANFAAWFARTAQEWGNISLALDRCARTGDHAGLARFLVAVWPFVWLDNRLVDAAGWMGRLRPHIETLDRREQGQASFVDAFIGLETGDFERARELGLRGIEIASEVGDEELRGMFHLILAGSLPAFDHTDSQVEGHLDEAIAIFRARGETANLGYALQFLGTFETARGDITAARAAIQEALTIAPTLEVFSLEAQSHALMAFLEFSAGDIPAAEDHLDAGFEALQIRPNHEVLSYLLDGYGWLSLVQGHVIEGLTAMGAAEAVRERIGLRMWPMVDRQLRALAGIADSYTDPESRAARAAGRRLPPEAALQLVRRGAEPAAA